MNCKVSVPSPPATAGFDGSFEMRKPNKKAAKDVVYKVKTSIVLEMNAIGVAKRRNSYVVPKPPRQEPLGRNNPHVRVGGLVRTGAVRGSRILRTAEGDSHRELGKGLRQPRWCAQFSCRCSTSASWATRKSEATEFPQHYRRRRNATFIGPRYSKWFYNLGNPCCLAEAFKSCYGVLCNVCNLKSCPCGFSGDEI